jgi:hypothetical protein
MQRQSSAKVIPTGMLLSTLSVALVSGSASAAQEAIEVAFVENVSGRVVALAAAKPTLLDALDVVTDGTRLDLQPNRTTTLPLSNAPVSHAERTCACLSLAGRGSG